MTKKLKDVMTANPACCVGSDTVQHAAKLMTEHDAGAIPVVTDHQSRKLEGMITDRDICCSLVAQGKDPKTATVGEHMTRRVVSCGADDDLDSCTKAMQENQVRRLPVVDGQGCCIGIVSQADLALKADEPDKVHQTVAAVSKPTPQVSAPRAA